MAKVSEVGDCWVWTGATCGVKQYGIIHLGADSAHSSRLVHRISYEIHVGPIPDGMEVDHLCDSTLCVRPDHLEAVSPEENIRRKRLRRTACRRSHEYAGDNLGFRSDGKRYCKQCLKDGRPKTTRRSDIQTAVRVSDATGTAFNAT